MSALEDRNRAVLDTLFGVLAWEGWGSGFLATLRDDVVFNAMGQSPISGRYEGKDIYRTQVLERLHERIAQSPKLTPISMLVDGEMACVRFQSRGGVGVNGADFSMDYCWVFHILDGGIKEIWGYYDTAKMIALFAD
ncbi:nuclear transport factor 2 family protein [Consotaella aegiceratis]|uniref:nuclear transport factor 2 family protein n=1 Tax=Consotaella aegiceratis TaxID=3097961 RepID=UPI002F407414